MDYSITSRLRAGVGAHAVALAADGEDRGVMQQAIDDGSGHHLVGEDLTPIGEAPIARQDN